ncbi:hypothetical protein D3C73_1529790 [compost metagenome]
MVRPKKSLNCIVPMVIAMPEVKPRVTGSGMYSISRPKRASPISRSMTPDIRVASNNPDKPNCCDTG